jgi:23S rRNA (uracil1939-C5)-methyltransferase
MEFTVRIEKLVYGGWGLGRHEGKVVFVPFAAPGDRLVVKPEIQKKSYLRASAAHLLDAGPGRIEPPCPHFGKCGGCHWQHLEYVRQLEAKQQILAEAFAHRFPGTGDLAVPMLASPAPYGYRSRARLQVQSQEGKTKVGFFRHQSHNVEDIEYCPLLRSSLNRGLTDVRRLLVERRSNVLPAQVDLACSEEEQRWACAGIGTDESCGAESLQRRVGAFMFQVSPSVFFQANDFLTAPLVELIRTLGAAGRKRSALDLFAGVGLFSIPLAHMFENVVAVESEPGTCDLARANVSQAGLDNVRIMCAGVSAWMEAAGTLSPPQFDLILLDPPRVGAGREVMHRIAEWTPETILYVSCDPQTLVRDLAWLPAGSYRIDSVDGLDMFPQTYHFETVVRLSRQ